ncbi:hypothetical protein ES703_90005 [subsurface metagenome]
MNIFSIFIGLFLMLLFYFAIHMIINRGKIELKYLLFILLYSLFVGTPVAYFNIFPERFNPIFYIVYYIVILLPSLGLELYNCMKGRQAWRIFILLFVGIVLILLSPTLETGRFLIILIGFLFLTGFFVYHFRYPHLNPMWLDDMAKKAAGGVEKKCRYSSKPVIVHIPSQKTSCSRSFGIFLLFKKKNAVVKISRDFHEMLGRPNMERYAEELVRRIKEKIKEEGR